MGFFVGLPGTPGNDQLAEKIASNSVRFVKENWRREDMQTYVSQSYRPGLVLLTSLR